MQKKPRRSKVHAAAGTALRRRTADRRDRPADPRTAAALLPVDPHPTAPEAGGCAVVGLGASAGGLEALTEFFTQLPADTGMAFVVVTHQHPGYVSLLPEILGKKARIPVLTAKEGARLEPDRAYIGPPGVQVAIAGGRLRLSEAVDAQARRLPIDFFLRTLAEDLQERAIGIILSGTGTDGTLGVKAIKAGSGMVMVQDVGSAGFAGMPSSAMATGLADYVLAPAAMPAQLLAYVRGPYLNRPAARPLTAGIPDAPLQEIFALLQTRTRHDFSSYKAATIQRRIERRMNVQQIKEPGDYVRYLRENPAELDLLFKELLISVTRFFRDREAWEALAGVILPERLRSLPDHYALRAWVPGCATGEEAYSLAILLRECADRLRRNFDVQVFGTDLDAQAIETARAGRYPEGIAADVPPEWLDRYFTRGDHDYCINKEIRELVVFAPQNVTRDPPFTRLDLLSCRNLLIYLNAGLQQQLLQLFHHALKAGGLLLLGSSETIGAQTDSFRIIDRKWKIFSRRPAAGPEGLRFPTKAWAPAAQSVPPVPVRAAEKEQPVPKLVEKVLLTEVTPPSVLVDIRGDVLYVHGRTGRYLEPAAGGQPRSNILEMAREGLEAELRTALHQAATGEGEVIREQVRVKSNGSFSHVDVTVRRLREPETLRDLLLVTFHPIRPVPAARSPGPGKPASRRVAQLTRELKTSQESLRATIADLATANEELRSANEELQSTNEEMQSTNEELETSREEMQSLNEELTTVNAEQQARVDALARARDDMQNLLNATEVATLFLDNDLRIRRYTESATRLIRLIPSDLGRSIVDQASTLKYDRVAADCRTVIATLQPREAEVETQDGSWHLMRILPYRTIENVIDGLVITFIDITRVTLAERKGRELRVFFESIIGTVRQPLVVLDESLHLVLANKAFYETFRLRPRQVEGELIFDLGGGEWESPDLRLLLEQILPQQTTIEGFRIARRFPKIGHRIFFLNARRLEQAADLPGMILLAFEDATGRQAEA